MSIKKLKFNLLLFIISLCFILICTNFSSSAAFSPSTKIKFDIIDPSSSGSITPIGNSSGLDVDILVNPTFPDFIPLPHFGDTINKKPGYAYVGSNPSFEARLNTKNNNLNVKSIDIIDSQNRTFFEIPFKVLPVPDTENEIVLTLNIPNNISSGLAKFILNTNDGSALAGEIEVIDFFNIKIKGDSKNFGEPSVSRASIKKIDDDFFLTIQGKNFAPKKLIYSSKDSPSEKIESSSRSNTSIIILPSTLNAEIEEPDVSKGNDSIKIKFKLSDDLEEDASAVIIISTPRGIISKVLTLKASFFDF